MFFEAINVNFYIHQFRHNRAKVICREGNSPDWKLRYLIIVKSKEKKLIYYLGDRLGSSHSLKKA